MQEFLGAPVMDNNLRGYWCEAMVAEALGKECRITSKGWAPWDLEIGPTNADYPARIRIQVKCGKTANVASRECRRLRRHILTRLSQSANLLGARFSDTAL
jgi:hypothetical protein